MCRARRRVAFRQFRVRRLDGRHRLAAAEPTCSFRRLVVVHDGATVGRRQIIGDEMDDICGLYSKAPTEAMLMLVFLLSLAGIPPLAGFYGKYFIFLSLIQTQHYLLASVAVLYAVLGLYYYMRIASAMFMRPAVDTEPVEISAGMSVALAITGVATIAIGVFPEAMIRASAWSLGIQQAGASVISLLK